MALPRGSRPTAMARLLPAVGHEPVTHVLAVEIDGKRHTLALNRQQEAQLDLDLAHARLRHLNHEGEQP